MISSTLGFIYSSDLKKVLLIEKQRPAHHKGKLNGLGGKCEPNEDVPTCISREVEEESGLRISSTEWKSIGTMTWEEWHVEIFVTIFKGDAQAASLTEDKVAWYPVSQLPKNVLTNLPWLIPLGIDYLTNDLPPTVKISYPDSK